jgi:hypothetical protein
LLYLIDILVFDLLPFEPALRQAQGPSNFFNARGARADQ